MALELEHMIGFNGNANSPLHVHPNGNDILYAQGGCIVIADMRDPHKQSFLRGHDDTVTCLTLSPSGKWVVSGQNGDNSDVIVWDFETKAEVYRFQEHDNGVMAVELSDDERFLLTVGNEKDKKLVVWDMLTGCIVVCKSNLKTLQHCACWGGRKKDAKGRETTQYQIATGGPGHVTYWSLDPMRGTMSGEDCSLGNQACNCLVCSQAHEARACLAPGAHSRHMCFHVRCARTVQSRSQSTANTSLLDHILGILPQCT
eukprot:3473112-Prymnesium_polylepis.2